MDARGARGRVGVPGAGARGKRWRRSLKSPVILIEGADAPLHGLLEEWLAEHGLRTVQERLDLILLDLPLVRAERIERVKQLSARYPRTPLVALSSNFFARSRRTARSRALSAFDAVLPKPLSRDALMGALSRLLHERE